MVVFTSGIVDVRCRLVRFVSSVLPVSVSLFVGGVGVGVEPGCGWGWWVVGTLLGV